MIIHTLGTGHGDSSRDRFNTSVAYETESGRIYLVDAGAPCEALIRRQGLLIKDVRAVFVTHMHDDHAGGLSGLIKQVTKYKEQRDGLPFTVVLPEDRAIDAIKTWISVLHEDPVADTVDYRATDDGAVYTDEEVTVTAIRTAHLRTRGREAGEPCSFAYILDFHRDGVRVLHTGDLRYNFDDFPKIALEEHFDVCLCEATHYNPKDAEDMLKSSKFGRLIFNHVGPKWSISVGECWELKNGEKELLSLCRDYPYPVHIAHDGEQFII